MTDYRLEGLGSRSFEHMVQALCVKALTELITPFGDGPDGGREATFDGPTRYGTGAGCWDGYGVVQAKFLQRPADAASNGKWVLNELKTELAKYEGRASERRMDYYILVTNVVLTPVAGSGSKDKVIAELDAFKRTYGLKDVDVWDYDKLRIFLDNNEEVRRTYSAWVTPGDVLTDLAAALKTQRPDFHRLIVRFLQREMLSDQFAKLEQAGHSADEKIPLSQVFVDVPVASKPYNESMDLEHSERSQPFANLIIREASHHCRDDDWTLDSVQRRGVIGRHVLIGGPGQGKTTVGQYICQVFRAALLEKVPQGAVDHEALSIVRAIRRAWNEGLLVRPGARRLPFRVVLSEFAKSLADGQTHSLLTYLTSLFNMRASADLTTTQFETMLTAYPSVLILDGLDEVPASTNRAQVLNAVKEFWAEIAASRLSEPGIDVMVVATSRPQGYNEDFSPKYYSHHWMVPLLPTQAIAYGNKLAEVRFSGDTDRIAKVQRRIRRASENAATARLMRSPLQVTILTLLLDRMGQPPQERWPLFDEYFSLIYQREIERDIPAAAILREHKNNIVTVHQHVGLLLQVEAERSGGTDARLTVDQFRQIVELHLREEGYRGTRLEDLTGSIIEAASTRLVFLVGLELGQVGFEIRSLQEFMAAEGLMAASDPTTQQRLRAVASNINWRNVFLFAAGKCFFDRQYLRDTIHTICSELNDDPDDRAAQYTLAGSELALDVLEEGSARRQPRWSRLLTRTALRLLDDTSTWCQRLANVWQEDTTDVFMSEIRTRIEGSEPRSAQNAWLCLSHLAAHPGGTFSTLLIELLNSRTIDEHLYEAMLEKGDFGCQPLTIHLGNSVLEHSATTYVNAQRFARYVRGRDERRSWELAGAPAWLDSLNAIVRNSIDTFEAPPEIQIVGPGSSITRINIPRFSGPIELALRCGSFAGGENGWDAIGAYLGFLGSPSKVTLATVLRMLGALEKKRLINVVAQVSPWPLSEVISAAKQTGRFGEMATAAEDGHLGDLEDWLTWQQAWHDHGMTVQDILGGDVADFERPQHHWVPIRVMMRHHFPVRREFYPELVAIVSGAAPGAARDYFVRLSSLAINNESRKLPANLPPIFNNRRFLEVVLRRSWNTGIKCLSLLSEGGLNDQSWREIITATAPQHLYGRVFYTRELAGAEVVERTWLENPDFKELLIYVLHSGVAEPMRARFTETLANLDVSLDGNNIKIARLLLLAQAGRWDDAMAIQAIKLAKEDSGISHLLAESAGRSLDDPLKREVLLLRLYDDLVAVGASAVPYIDELRQCIKSRRSSLTDATIWRDLGLPPELSEMIGL
ncbi:NACHT domain-containing protein [Nonomuraea fuscirosea]|uniref:NACHT domain-containing protein n=1 Tax=Nonomuraea fuscirosea TaxID=1291556 RepID=UPI0033DFD8E6